MLKIAVVGDRNESVRAHQALPQAIELARDGVDLDVDWVGTAVLGALLESKGARPLAEALAAIAPRLAGVHGL